MPRTASWLPQLLRPTARQRVLAVSISIGAFGCGSKEQPTSSGIKPSEYCDRLASRSRTCNSPTVENSDCAAGLTCRQALFTSDAVASLYECAINQPCMANEAECYQAAVSRFQTNEAAVRFKDECVGRSRSCDGSFTEDSCVSDYPLFNEKTRGAYSACLKRDCGAIAACFEAVYRDAGCLN